MEMLEVKIDFSDVDTEMAEKTSQALRSHFAGQQGVEVLKTPSAELPKGAMSGEAFTLGALALAVLPTFLPAVLDTLKNLRGMSTKIMIKNGEKQIDLEFPKNEDPEKIKKLTQELLKSLS